MKRPGIVPLLFALASPLAPGLAFAEAPGATATEEQTTKERAQESFARGIEDFRAGRYKDAIDAFQHAHDLYPSAAISFNIARAYEKLEDSAAALRFYREYLRQEPAAPDAAQVAARVEGLEDRLRFMGVQQVTVISNPAGATLSVDGRPLGITPWTGEIHPGNHKLELQHQGFVTRQEHFNLSPHRSLELELELEAERPVAAALPAAVEQPRAAAMPPDVQLEATPSAAGFVDYLPWLSLGAAGLAFASAGYFELSSAGAEDDARGAPTQAGALEHIREMQGAQTSARVLLGVGSALAVTSGILFWITSKEPAAAGELSLGCGLTRCAVQGEF